MCLEGTNNSWLFLPSHPLVTIAAGMLRRSISTQLTLRTVVRTEARKQSVS